MSATAFPPFDVGSFRILGLLGRGGMGNVWDARHLLTGLPVAVKTVASRDTERAAALRAAFAREVLAMARLDHPCVVAIYEQGAVDAATAAASGRRLDEGSPWLAMERANAGTLRSGLPIASWADLRSCLLQLLDALAHAHARGVVHRDLKPGNVLVHRDSGSVRLMLSDFGLAHALAAGDARAGAGSSGGTPGYMAPEQILGLEPRQGPWTDLYALGVLAWRTACGGSAPFRGESGDSVLRAQLEDDRAVFEPSLAVPAGFEAWLEAMTAHDETRRPACAADAAQWLRELGDVTERSSAQRAVVFADIAKTLMTTDVTSVATASRARLEGGVIDRHSPPPLPEAFAEQDAPRRRPIPPGVGASLFGIRTVKLRSREGEQELLWRELRTVARDSIPRTAVLRGTAGSGKTRLAQWLVQRGHELAGVRSLYVRHTPGVPPYEPLRRALRDELRVSSNSRAAAYAQASERFAGHAHQDLVARMAVQLVAPSPRADGYGVRFSSAAERHRAVAHVAEALGAGRPLVLVMDDAHFSIESLVLCRDIAASDLRIPLLVVATVRDEVVEESPSLSEQVAMMPAVHLGVLDTEGRRRMLADLFPLAPEVVGDVARWTGGSPLLAHHLVSHLVETGALVHGAAGHRLANGTALPASELDLWERRLAHVARGARDAIDPCLEVAAALGMHVRLDDLRDACEEAGVHAPEGVGESLVAAGLAHPTPRGWVFVHESLRTTQKRRAVAEGRWGSIQLACARVYERGGFAQAPLAARCYEEAGALAEAVPLLFAAHDTAVTGGDHAAALGYANRLDRVLGQLGVPPTDPRWVRCQAERIGRMLYVRAKHEDAPAALAQAFAQAPPDSRLLLVRSQMLSLRGDMIEAHREAARAVAAIADEGNDLLADALVTLAGAASSIGRVSETVRCIERLETLVGEDALLQARLELTKSKLHLVTGDYDEVQRTAIAACERFERLGDRVQVGLCWTNRGEAHRCAGNYAAARTCYGRAADAFRQAASPVINLIILNMLLLRVQEGEIAGAREGLHAFEQEVRGTLTEDKHGRSTAPALAVCAAREGDWATFDAQLARAAELGPGRGHVSRDLGMLSELAGDLAAREHEHDRAIRAWELALAQLAPLDPAARDRLSQKLSEAPGAG